MIIIFLIVLGLILGSFVNALVWRFHEQAERIDHKAKKRSKKQPTDRELSMLHGRSMCSNCYHPLATKDLIPLFSWLALKGKCRYCHKPIPDSPIIEAVLPILFVTSYLAWPGPLDGWQALFLALWLVFVTGFAALAAYDFRWYLLPDRIVWPLAVLGVVYAVLQLIHGSHTVTDFLALGGALLIASGLFYVLFQVSNGNWIGGGDVKLGIVIGLLVATPLKAMLVLFIASVLGTVIALPLLALGKAERTTKLPFGPYLLVATFAVVLWGTQLVSTYYHIVGLR